MTSLSFAQASRRCPLSEADAAILLASGTKNATTQVDIHPVVLLHIADHYHRNVAQHASKLQGKIFSGLHLSTLIQVTG